jgi:hypothetical protein
MKAGAQAGIGCGKIARGCTKAASNRCFCDSSGDGCSHETLPNDADALQAALIAERGRRIVAETDAACAKAGASDDHALIAYLQLQIEKLNRDRYGPRSERTARLLDQLELTQEELEASATEDQLAAEMAAARTANATTWYRCFVMIPARMPVATELISPINSFLQHRGADCRMGFGNAISMPTEQLSRGRN